jgi:hypothetical protein
VKQVPVSEISREQEYVAGLYERVDALREQASARLALALREDGGTPQSRLDRDAAIARYAGHLARLDAAENGCASAAAILAGSPRGLGDLYVAMTRSTRRLGVLHPGRPPEYLAGLGQISGVTESGLVHEL